MNEFHTHGSAQEYAHCRKRQENARAKAARKADRATLDEAIRRYEAERADTARAKREHRRTTRRAARAARPLGLQVDLTLSKAGLAQMRSNLIVFGGVLLLALVSVLLTGCSVGASYVDKAVEKLSADNVEAEYDHVITKWNSLSVAADNACLASAPAAGATGAPVLVESPVMAYAATYRNSVADYNSRQADIFKAGFVGPLGYPDQVPNYPEAAGATPDFCSISTALATLKGAAE